MTVHLIGEHLNLGAQHFVEMNLNLNHFTVFFLKRDVSNGIRCLSDAGLHAYHFCDHTKSCVEQTVVLVKEVFVSIIN